MHAGRDGSDDDAGANLPETGREIERLPPDAVAAALGVDAVSGLSRGEAHVRAGLWGPNALRSRPPVPTWRRLTAQLADPLVLLLVAAAAVSAGLWLRQAVAEGRSGPPFEALAILGIVVLNAAMGVLQEARAERAVAALRRMSAARARVVRDGIHLEIPATELVPGDVIRIEEGDAIPADARLIATSALRAGEAALTGESVPVPKNALPKNAMPENVLPEDALPEDASSLAGDASLDGRRTMVFSGTTIVAGRGLGIVTATGMRTELGRIAGMLEDTQEEATPLQVALARLGRRLGLAVLVIAAALAAIIVLAEEVRTVAALLETLIVAVALAVAAVPEGLPAIVTAALSLGVLRMARRRAIVRRLAAVETLGSADVIASDKTGTLTRNTMTVRTVVTAGGRSPLDGAPAGRDRDGRPSGEVEAALLAGALANDAVLQEREGGWTVQGDPTEGALLLAARNAGLDAALRGFVRLGEIPFSSERRRMSAVHREAGRDGVLVALKGAPEVVLSRCTRERADGQDRPLTPARREAILAASAGFAGDGLRTLGLAHRRMPDGGGAALEEVEQDLVFLGLVGMSDPPRPEAREAVARARTAGIRSVMITGDHPRTAAAVAAELGIAADGAVLTGDQIDALSPEALDEAVRHVSVYARVAPAHKLRIVRALQRNGLVVAMTGDGVNDAPALKAADIGIAMGATGTDVAREAADIVLADDNFATIVSAVEEGRAIFANIRKVLRYLLSSNLGEVAVMGLGVVLAPALGLAAGPGEVVLPLLATQILWINFVTDGVPALALAVDPADPAVMTLAPRPRREGVLTGAMGWSIGFVGLVTASCSLFVLDACLPGGLVEGTGTPAYARTMTFTTLVLCQLFNVLNARSGEASALDGLFGNRWLWAAVVVSLLLQVAVIETPVLQRGFSTVSLSLGDWLYCAGVASGVLVLEELRKAVLRARRAVPPGLRTTEGRGPAVLVPATGPPVTPATPAEDRPDRQRPRLPGIAPLMPAPLGRPDVTGQGDRRGPP
ncbi:MULTISPECIES: cation-translocating P-type ATPase [Methylobacterium]|uniref:cation-translocating P-type ATPase n=1 Tax=Methylobacterium TaxID=407 RepID=UPI0013ED1620|nr:cation-translocating P-type ATPase [Methylobacterium sp. DB0501]